MPRGYDRPLYFLPFDRRGSFHTNMFGWKGDLNEAQTAEIARRYREFVNVFEMAGSATVTRTAA
jgi:hypothetical protein